MPLLGNPLAKAFSAIPKQTITGNGTVGPYTLDYAAGSDQDVEVYVNNVRQEPGVAYTVAGTSMTMTGVVQSSDDFYVVFQGSAQQTAVPAAGSVTDSMIVGMASSKLTGALPAINGSALTSLSSSALTGALPAINGSALTSLSSSALTGALPAIDGSSLTSLSSSALTGALPAIDGSALTGLAGISVAVIADQKAVNVDGGTATAGAWRTRDLNTELHDPDGIVSISGNQFNLGAGKYLIQWAAPAFKTEEHQTRLWNATSSSVVALGKSAYGSSGRDIQQDSSGSGYVSLGSSANFQIQHYPLFTFSTEGWGKAGSWGNNIYTLVTIFKVG